MTSKRPPRGRPVLTGRALLLGAVVVLLVVVLAAPVHRYLASRNDAASSAQQLRDDRAALAKLQAQKAQYGDPGYIQQQARERLQYAMPGDTVFSVVDSSGRTDIEKSTTTRTDSTDTGAWNTRLWASVRAAG